MITSTKCVIVANGEFPKRELTMRLLHSAEVIIACDGATRKLLANNIDPSYIIGDLDSLSKEIRHIYADRIIEVSDQECNDLTKAVNFAHSLGYKEAAILAATGLREDHTLGNISLLANYAQKFDRIEIISDYGCFKAISKSSSFASHPGQQVSIFVMHPLLSISSIGLLFPIEDRVFTQWWEGTLNEAIGSSFALNLDGVGSVIVYRTHME
ncbi:MAG: thiamine diphosphokinase [Bacteroidales bacterium]